MVVPAGLALLRMVVRVAVAVVFKAHLGQGRITQGQHNKVILAVLRIRVLADSVAMGVEVRQEQEFLIQAVAEQAV